MPAKPLSYYRQRREQEFERRQQDLRSMNHWQIHQVRRQMGLTQREFAKVMGVKYWTVVKWEHTVNDWRRQPSKSARVLLHQLLRWVPVVLRTNQDRDIPPRFLSYRFKGKIRSFPF